MSILSDILMWICHHDVDDYINFFFNICDTALFFTSINTIVSNKNDHQSKYNVGRYCGDDTVLTACGVDRQNDSRQNILVLSFHSQILYDQWLFSRTRTSQIFYYSQREKVTFFSYGQNKKKLKFLKFTNYLIAF